MNSLISVHVVIPNVCVKKIKLDTSLPFSSFQRLFEKNSKRIFIYNGLIIDEKNTLIEVGVHDNDSIVAVSKENDVNSENNIIWMNITKDIDYFNEKVQDYIKMDPIDFARLKDQIHNKKKSSKNIILQQQVHENNNSPFDTTFKKGNGPSIHALPPFF